MAEDMFSRQVRAAWSRSFWVISICISFSASTNVEVDTAGPDGGDVPNAGGAPGVSAAGFGDFSPQPAAAPMTASEEYFKKCLRDPSMIFSNEHRIKK
jgi:hypothetical protein